MDTEIEDICRRAGLREGGPYTYPGKVLWQDDNDDVSFTAHSHIYFTLEDAGKRIGFMSLEEVKLKLKDWEDDWLEVDNVGVQEAYRGRGYGRKMYESVLATMNPAWAGLVSNALGRYNKKEVPHLYKTLGAQSTPDGLYWFIDNPNRG